MHRVGLIAALLVLASLGGGCLGACRREEASLPDAGRPRVVSLHDVTTEMAVRFGAGAKLVGVSEPVDLEPALAAVITRVPRVGGLESILMLRPDLVLGLGVVEEQDPELVRRLREAGVEVLLGDPLRVEDVVAFARLVGSNLAASDAAEHVVASFERTLAPRPSQRAAPKRVFVYDCCNPPFTAGRDTVLTDLIERAGGQNIFGDLDADWAHVSWEDVIERRPELVVVHAYHLEGQEDVPRKREALREIPSLSGVPVVTLPLGCSLGGLRSIEGFERLSAALEERS